MNARYQPTLFVPLTGSMRARIEATIEHLTALPDEIDGDADFEPGSDSEPSLGWCAQGGSSFDPGDDRELDDADYEDDDPEEEDDEGEDDGTDEEDLQEIYEEWVRGSRRW